MVKQGRGQRLKESPGAVQRADLDRQRSIELGLADALGSVDYVARDVIKAEDIVDFTPRENMAERFARRFGAATAEALVRLTVRRICASGARVPAARTRRPPLRSGVAGATPRSFVCERFVGQGQIGGQAHLRVVARTRPAMPRAVCCCGRALR